MATCNLAIFGSCPLVEEFPEPRLVFARRHNEALQRQYDVLAERLGRAAHVMGPDPDRHLADYGHKWALEPFHYEQALSRTRATRK